MHLNIFISLLRTKLTVNLNYYELGLITSISARLGIQDLRKKYGQPRLSLTIFCAALNIAFRVELCHNEYSWCTEANVCICLDNAEKKSGSILFKDERRFYTFQSHTTLLSYAHNNNIDYIMICNFQLSIIMAVISRYW